MVGKTKELMEDEWMIEWVDRRMGGWMECREFKKKEQGRMDELKVRK